MTEIKLFFKSILKEKNRTMTNQLETMNATISAEPPPLTRQNAMPLEEEEELALLQLEEDFALFQLQLQQEQEQEQDTLSEVDTEAEEDALSEADTEVADDE